MDVTVVILVVALVVVAAVALVLVLSLQSKAAKANLELVSKYEEEKSGLVSRYEAEKDALQEKLAVACNEKTALESRLKANEEHERELRESQEIARKEAAQAMKEQQEKAARVMQEQHEKELKQMKEVFENLSARNSDAFKARSAETIAELLKPVQEKFKEFSDSVKESQKESADRHSKLEQKIIDLDVQSKSVGDEARNLANALTGYSKIQGDFGEMLLTDVLKNAGLTEGVHFVTQGVMTDASGHEIKSDAGRTMIPDVMVYYPDDTTVIIDSKVSLKAYSDYMAAATVEERVKAAKAHAESVRSHVNELKAKNYAAYIPDGKRKVDFNIMFIPIEGAFRLMLEEDARLWQVAKDNNVLIVSQMTLIIVLNMIQMSWKQHEQEKNIENVYKTAEELMSQLKGWMDHFVKVGDSLEKASAAYSESKKKLTESNQSVIKKIEKLEKLGLAPKRSTAKIKTTGRLTGPESIIPQSLASLDSGSSPE